MKRIVRGTERRWTAQAEALLTGRKIVRAGWMDPRDAEEMGWAARPLVLRLDDGTVLHLLADDEGNGPGAAIVMPKGTATVVLPVLSLDD